MAGQVRDLKLWQEAVALAGDVVRGARLGARRETQVITDRLIETAVTIPECVTRGYASTTTGEQRVEYQAAKHLTLALETQVAVARHAELFTAGQQAALLARIQMVLRLLGGYLVYLERQLEEQ